MSQQAKVHTNETTQIITYTRTPNNESLIKNRIVRFCDK